jgi:phospholipid/cholesterol/gamma-HCH transport system ATP-binding protein
LQAIDCQRTVLNAKEVTLFAEGKDRGVRTRVHFDLQSGELALIRLNNLHQTAAFADTFSGLLQPIRGKISFLGREWQNVSTDTANAMRGKIGRVFSVGNWFDGITICDNILLPQSHHTRTPKDGLLRDAANLAKHFGLPGLPSGYPAEYTRADRRKSACVRAFLGRPALLLLEDPTYGIYPEILAPLVNAVRRARNRGAAVLWMTLTDDVWLDTSIPVSRYFMISGRELMEVKKKT